jgi:hypothetical protein
MRLVLKAKQNVASVAKNRKCATRNATILMHMSMQKSVNITRQNWIQKGVAYENEQKEIHADSNGYGD